MSPAPVTVAILAWNAWESTKACLDSLRATLGVRDQVVVVDNGSRDETAVGLHQYPWVDVVTNPTNRGFAGGCNDAAAAARRDIVVFLNNDTVLTSHWIEPLVAALKDPAVGAAGPRSNFVSGPQMVAGVSYSDGRGMRRFSREWTQSHRGQTSDVERLVGFCLAVRRETFERVGGFDEAYGLGGYEDDDFCQRLIKSGHRLVICHDSFVHHEGHKTFDANGVDWMALEQSNRKLFLNAHSGAPDGHVLVSACLITKDEEVNIASCLASLEGLADEIVIYDTGSRDQTVAVARSLGATVIEGYWDDDFSRARNAALEHCRGDWIAWLDADETMQCDDIPALRGQLYRTKPEIDGLTVTIHNLTGLGTGAGFAHRACRLFRRSSCEWVGRLHEQVTRRGERSGVVQAALDTATILHTGYLDHVMRDRNKTERNLRVAQAEVDEADEWGKGLSLTSLARSYLTAGRCQEALDRSTEALDHIDNPITRRLALRTCTEALLGLGRPHEALPWSVQLRAESSDPLSADLTEGKVRQALGDHARALELFPETGHDLVDEDGYGYPAAMIAAYRSASLAALGRFSEAADALITNLFADGALDTHLGSVIDCLQKAGRPLDDLAAVIPNDRAPVFLAQLLQIQPAAADATLEACLTGMEDTTAVLAAAATVSKRLPVDRALVWSARLRRAGHAFACPLIAVAASDGPPVLRARAAATALRAFGDVRASQSFWAAYQVASMDEQLAIRAEADQLCPNLLAGVPA